MKLKVKVINSDNFSKYTSEHRSGTNLFKSSQYQPLFEKTDDQRENEIESLLTDDYLIYLSYSDMEDFINMVENDTVICDLNQEDAKYLIQYFDYTRKKEKYTEEYILQNLDKDYHLLDIRILDSLPLSLFENHPDKFNWDRIS